MTLPVSDIVTVQMLVAPTAPVAAGFGVGLILGTAAVLPIEERIRSYSSIAGVVVDFASNTEEWKAANAYFGQTPSPAQLMIGRQFTANQAGKLRGSAGINPSLGFYLAITNGGFNISVNGTLIQVTALNLSGAGTMGEVANAIQTKLNAGLAETTCTWTGTYFLITSPSTGTASVVSFASSPTGSGSPVDVSASLGLTSSSGALAIAGINAETMTAALNASQAFNNGFFGVALTSVVTQDVLDAAAWAEGAKKAFFYTTNDPNAKLIGATSDLGYVLKNLNGQANLGVWSSAPYAAVSAMARAFIVDFSQPDIRRLHPLDNGEEIPLPAEALEWVATWEASKAALKAAKATDHEERKQEAENRLRAVIGPATFGVLPDGRRLTLKHVTTSAYVVAEKTYRTLRIEKPFTPSLKKGRKS